MPCGTRLKTACRAGLPRKGKCVVVRHATTTDPAFARRFPTISGIRVTFDSSRPPNQRVLGIWLLGESTRFGADGKPELVDKEEVLRASTRKYLIMCGEYMTEGGDGYESLKDKKMVVPAENGQSKSALIRKVLLGKFPAYFVLAYFLTLLAQVPNTSIRK